jgi:hypothetical protein
MVSKIDDLRGAGRRRCTKGKPWKFGLLGGCFKGIKKMDKDKILAEFPGAQSALKTRFVVKNGRAAVDVRVHQAGGETDAGFAIPLSRWAEFKRFIEITTEALHGDRRLPEKREIIRNLLAQGLSQSEIVRRTGFSKSHVCETRQRILRRTTS